MKTLQFFANRLGIQLPLVRIIFLFAILTLVVQSQLQSQVTGFVFRDYNGNGTKQAGEPGREGIIVKFYSNAALPGKDVYLGQTTTNSSGNYSYSPAVYPVRIEFEIPSGFCNLSPAQDFSGAYGGTYGTAVQFADGPEAHNFVISYPFDFSTESDPYVFVPIMGNGDPLDPAGNAKDQTSIVRFNYLNSGYASNSGRGNNSGHPYVTCAKHSQTGTCWGVAYSRQAKKIWTSAFLRRHSGLGPEGSGGIYWFDAEGPYDLNANLKFINLDELGFPTSDQVNPYTTAFVGGSCSGSGEVFFSPVIGSNSDRNLPIDKEDPSADPAAWAQVGRVSLGDLDISEDGRYLYVVNCYDRKLYEIDLVDPFNPQAPTIANAATRIKSWLIPDPCFSNPQSGEYRPYALKYSRGRVMVGIVCSGQKADGTSAGGDSQDLLGTIYEFNTSTDTWNGSPNLQFDFSYRDATSQPWKRWQRQWWFQGFDRDACPLIVDIELDAEGNIIVGVNDLHGSQIGHVNANLCGSCCPENGSACGDILQAVRDKNSATCQYSISFSPEYYKDNHIHAEPAQGALSVHFTADFDGILATYMGPIDIWSFGTMLFNNKTGNMQSTPNANNVNTEGYELFYATSSNKGPFGKANSMGDLETVGVVPPIEVGNLVWLDVDKDGVQDGGEPGIQGVNMEFLDANGNVVGTTVTDSKGGYYFNLTNVVDTVGASKPNVLGPQPFTSYMIRIAASHFNGVGLGPIAAYTLTATDVAGAGLADYSDNDATNVAGIAKINITTGGPGENVHTYDFGLIGCPKPICESATVTKQ